MDKNNVCETVLKIILYKPEIPENTGNIGRLCVGTNTQLHIIKPMKFFLNDKYLKRAGLDYWEHVDLKIHENYDNFLENTDNSNIYLFSTKAEKHFYDIRFNENDALVFGPESSGLPNEMLQKYYHNVYKIPMSENIRSINLANSVAIVLYEAIRQLKFDK
jgi:tRNA (cytidine/uridine-2'-O-)-methyltransferase